MARPNFPMMNLNMPGMHPNMHNLSHPPPMHINLMPGPLGGFSGVIPQHMPMPGNIIKI